MVLSRKNCYTQVSLTDLFQNCFKYEKIKCIVLTRNICFLIRPLTLITFSVSFLLK